MEAAAPMALTDARGHLTCRCSEKRRPQSPSRPFAWHRATALYFADVASGAVKKISTQRTEPLDDGAGHSPATNESLIPRECQSRLRHGCRAASHAAPAP